MRFSIGFARERKGENEGPLKGRKASGSDRGRRELGGRSSDRAIDPLGAVERGKGMSC